MVIKIRSDAGFTLIEVIVVVLLIGLAAALALPRGLREAADGAAVDAESQKLAGIFRLAGQKAAAQKQKCIVKLNSSDYTVIMEKGAAEKPVSRDQRIRVKSVPEADIEFLPSGVPAHPFTVILESTGGNPQSKTIEVNGLGIVDIK